MVVKRENEQNERLISYIKQAKEVDECLRMANIAIQRFRNIKESDILGITMVKSDTDNVMLELHAQYAHAALGAEDARPLIQVVYIENNIWKSHSVDISAIKPEHASHLEIFALSAYADAKGRGSDSLFGTFNTFKYYEDKAVGNGALRAAATLHNFLYVKYNWMEMILSARELFKESEMDKQYGEGAQLMALLLGDVDVLGSGE